MTFGSSAQNQTLVAWKGQGGAHIFYQASPTIGVKKSWSAKAEIPGAASTAALAVASYQTPTAARRWSPCGVETAAWCSTPRVRPWPARRSSGRASPRCPRTSTAPPTPPRRCSSLQDRYVAVVAYRGPHDPIRFIEGVPSHRGFTWRSASQEVSPTAVANSGPTIAELQTGTGHGILGVFWRDKATGGISYAATTAPLAASTSGTWTIADVPGAKTSDNPAASALGQHGTGPLILAYKAAHGAHIKYQTLTTSGWSTPRPGAQHLDRVRPGADPRRASHDQRVLRGEHLLPRVQLDHLTRPTQ